MMVEKFPPKYLSSNLAYKVQIKSHCEKWLHKKVDNNLSIVWKNRSFKSHLNSIFVFHFQLRCDLMKTKRWGIQVFQYSFCTPLIRYPKQPVPPIRSLTWGLLYWEIWSCVLVRSGRGGVCVWCIALAGIRGGQQLWVRNNY